MMLKKLELVFEGFLWGIGIGLGVMFMLYATAELIVSVEDAVNLSQE